MGLFSTLNVGTRGLTAAQLGMDVAGQNISNADVEGYSRKRLNMTADYRYDPQFGQMGFGVEVINIQRVRDIYIDQQIRRQNEYVGYFNELDYTLERIENLFTEPSDTGLLNYIDQFFDSWQNLVNNPADISARTMVKTNAEILVDVFHNMSTELGDLRQSRNDDIRNKIERVNAIVKEMFEINKEIGTVEARGQNANDSRDRRDLLLKELSNIIDVDVVENDIGQITVTSQGNILLSPVNYQEMETTTSSRRLADGTTVTDIGIRFKNSSRNYMPMSGELRGLFDARDKVIPEYEDSLDTLAVRLIETVNEVHYRGFNLFGYSGINFFDPQVTGASDIQVSASILSDVQYIAAAAGGGSQSASDPFGSIDFGDPATDLSNRNIINGTVVVTAGGTELVENTDYVIDYTNGTIQTLHNTYDGVPITVDYEYSTGSYQGPGDNTNAVAIAQLRQQLTMDPDPLGNSTATYSEYYSSMIGRLGLNRQEAESNLETREFLVQQYESHQDSIAGVSLDEEMADLVKYQHTYQAAARLISTVSDMLDILMNI
jgi:flagellar hook-associated protein 1 FlgK